jgi:hypothetical protein
MLFRAIAGIVVNVRADHAGHPRFLRRPETWRLPYCTSPAALADRRDRAFRCFRDRAACMQGMDLRAD